MLIRVTITTSVTADKVQRGDVYKVISVYQLLNDVGYVLILSLSW